MSAFCFGCKARITGNSGCVQCILCEEWYCGKEKCKEKIYYLRHDLEKVPKCEKCIIWKEDGEASEEEEDSWEYDGE